MRLPCGTLLFASGLALWGQLDPVALLERARDSALAAKGDLTRYACSQTIVRETYLPLLATQNPLAKERTNGCAGSLDGPGMMLARRDRLRLELTVAGGREWHSWPEESPAERAGGHSLGADGLMATGDFASFLSDVLPRKDVVFSRLERRGSGESAVYRYSVPQAESRYEMDAGRGRRMRLGYGGEIRVDRQTGDPRQLSIVVEKTPKASGSCRVETEITYGHGETGRLRPVETMVRMWEADGTRYENRVQIATCRIFGSQSTLRTDAAPEPAASVPAAVPRDVPILEGLPVQILLRGTIRDGMSAGDRVEGRITGDVRDAAGHVVLGAGTAVRGRIVRLTQNLQPSAYFVLGLQFPGFRAKARSKMEASLSSAEERRSGIGLYLIPGETLSLGSDFVTEWVTAKN